MLVLSSGKVILAKRPRFYDAIRHNAEETLITPHRANNFDAKIRGFSKHIDFLKLDHLNSYL